MPMVVSAKANRFLRMGANFTEFGNRIPQYEAEAATLATDTSRLIFSRWHSGRPLAPARPRRPTTSGTFASLLNWRVSGNGLVRFDVAELSEKAPYWEIQEIGTGQTATVYGASGEGIAVRSQVGRRLPPGFYWGTDVGGSGTKSRGEYYRDVPSPFRSPTRNVSKTLPLIGQQNLFPIALAAPGTIVRARGTIHREIKGKHFVRDGGIEGLGKFRHLIETDYKELIR